MSEKRGKTRKLTRELFLVMLVSAVVAVSCMLWLYNTRMAFYAWTVDRGFVKDGREEYKEWILEQTPGHKLYPFAVEEADRENFDEKNLPFLRERRDEYTGVFIYEKDSGRYVTGYMPSFLDNDFWGAWLWSDADIFSQGQQPMIFDAEFEDCSAEVHLSSYMIMQVIPVYLSAGIVLCVTIFLIPVLAFVHQRMLYLGKVRSEVLVMAEGDLEHPLTVKGGDEISSLAQELDDLRKALSDNIEKERQSHCANQELIRAMSHDLRTPLTTLYGYLEILDHGKGNVEKYPEYVRRCLSKTEEIRAMSDKMFEYALVFDGQENVDMCMLPLNMIWEEFREQADYLKTQGFQINMTPQCLDGKFSGNAFLVKRLAANLFSNIQRYGERKLPVEIYAEYVSGCIGVVMRNSVRSDKAASGSGVGLRSASRITSLHGGKISWREEDGIFTVSFSLPYENNSDK
ncbi:MAG: HAMP domain-containing sensor histidine kinase [Eubacteriales bacterium]|nr:HAMP domain-containing sensor histidine kinase [Eubacteriales bacterium]